MIDSALVDRPLSGHRSRKLTHDFTNSSYFCCCTTTTFTVVHRSLTIIGIHAIKTYLAVIRRATSCELLYFVVPVAIHHLHVVGQTTVPGQLIEANPTHRIDSASRASLSTRMSPWHTDFPYGVAFAASILIIARLFPLESFQGPAKSSITSHHPAFVESTS